MKKKRLAFAIILATAATAAAGSCDKGRSDIFETAPLWLSPVALASSVAIVSKTLEKAYLVSYDSAGDEPVVTTERVGRSPALAEASTGGSRLFVVCHGALEGEVRREDAQEESLHVIDTESGDHDVYILGNPFTGLAESAGGRWLIAYFRSEVPGNNPNLLALVDLEAEPSDGNPFIRAIRSLGSTPLGVVFLEDIDLLQPDGAIVKKNLALIPSESYVTLLDLDHPGRSEISIRLTVPGLGTEVIPTQEDVIVANDPAGLSSRVLLRSDNASDIFSITFIGIAPEEEGGNDYRVTLNQLSVDVNPNAAPTDMDLFLDNGRQLVLATNRIAGSIAVLDPETTMVTPILTDFPTDRIHLFDQGRSALLYAMGEEMAYFATLENIVEEKEMNLEEFSFGGPLSAFIPVPGRDFAAFMLSGEAQRIFFIDFLTREMHQVYLSGSAGSAQFLIYPDGSRMISDMTSYEVDPIIVDELVGRMWLLESSGKIILDHKYAEGYYTFIDADSPQRSTARSLWGFLFEDAASIDPDDYPMSKQP
jgi:hypothetical protein